MMHGFWLASGHANRVTTPHLSRTRSPWDPPLELTVGEEHIGVPTSDELLMEGKVTAEGERVRSSWS